MPVHPREPAVPEEDLWDTWDVKEGDAWYYIIGIGIEVSKSLKSICTWNYHPEKPFE